MENISEVTWYCTHGLWGLGDVSKGDVVTLDGIVDIVDFPFTLNMTPAVGSDGARDTSFCPLLLMKSGRIWEESFHDCYGARLADPEEIVRWRNVTKS